MITKSDHSGPPSKRWEYSGHITLQRGERSRLADYASEIL